MLEIENIHKCFGRVTALNGVSFAIPRGEIWGLAGANGAGKTTMLRILCGAEESDRGVIRWEKSDLLTDRALMRRSVALMPDVLPDAGDVTVAEYLDFHRRAFGRDAGAPERAEKFCGIAPEWRKRFLSELSRGMKQRVSLARMLVADPEVFLFDEPGAGLDPRGRVELRDLVRRLGDEGHTVIISSHILAELQEVVAGIVILEAGSVIACGKTGELCDRHEVKTLEELYLKLTMGAMK